MSQESSLPLWRLHRRIRWVAFFFFLAFAALGYRAFDLQVHRSKEFQKMVLSSQYLTIRLPARRGVIYDRNLAPLAISVEVDSIGANPRLLSNKPRAATLLSRALGLNRTRLLLTLAQDRYFVWIKRHVTPREVRAVQALRLGRAVRVVQENKRFYPNKNLASHLLGYTNRDGRGLAGVERSFDRLLRGKARSFRLPHDPKGRQILKPGVLKYGGRAGNNVVLTLDKRIQYIAEVELARAVKKARAKGGVALVMDPTNGDLLALAVAPDFNLNTFREVPTRLRNNSAVSNPYEPGSTFKAISMAVARQLGVFRLDERMDCENGRLRIGRYTIHDDHPHKWLTPLEVLKFSSNICVSKLARRVGKARFYQGLRRFGLGQRTGVGLPWESSGILHPSRRWANVTLATISFGQGISVTPLQLLTAINVIANGGTLYRPRLYKAVLNRHGRISRRIPPQKVRRVLSRRVAREITEMMVAVVSGKRGTGRRAAIPGIRVAGKTGTAQKPRPNGRGYSRERIGSFVGFLPADRPRLSILVVIDEPKGVKYGGVVAAPAWKRIARASLRLIGYFGHRPVRFESLLPSPAHPRRRPPPSRRPKRRAPPSPEKEDEERHEPRLARPRNPMRLAPKVALAPSPRQKASPKAPSRASSPRRKVPNFLGLTRRQVQHRARRLKLKLQIIGRGRARYQRPPAGSPLPPQTLIRVVCTS